MTSKEKLIFKINVNLPQKIKLLTLHPKKQWLALITTTNTFSLWNYKQKILIKSFNSNTLDDSKNFQIKEMVFFDRYSLPYNSNAPMRTNIIFVSPYRIYLYDYLTDAIKQINQKQIEQKNIKKLCVYSQSKICVSLGDGTFKVLDSRDLYTKNTMTIKNIRGYHTKPITWLIAYCQSANQMPRVITVSAQDGLMACWNVDTLLHSPNIPDPASPSFKFLMQKGSKNDSNNGEQILSLQYDSSSYRLITLTQSYITIWSTMTGMQLRRLKNHKYKEIVVCNHFSFGANSFLVHNNRSELLLLRQNANQYQVLQCLGLKGFLGENGDNNIVSIKALPQNPAQIFVCTQSNLCVFEINKFYRPSFGFHHSFITKLTTLNSKQFVIRSEGSIKPDIPKNIIDKIYFQQDILFNSFFLSFENGCIYFNLMEIQFENVIDKIMKMLYQQRKYKILKVAEESILSKPTNSQSLIQVRFDGKQFFVFNRDLTYFEIYASQGSNQEENLLMLNESSSNLDFYSKLTMINRGYARDITWHQFKQQLAVIKGFDKSGNLVEYLPQKKGLFGKNERMKLSAQIVNWHVCVYQKNKKTNKYEIILKSQALIKTIYFRVFNFGYFFGYSFNQNDTQIIKFINDQKNSNKEIEGVPIWPQRVFVSYCENFQIYVYDGYFIIYRVDQIGQLSYYRSVQQTIYQGMFWQKFFFFSTKTSIFFLQITNRDILLIKIADSICSIQQKTFNIMNDDLQDGQNKIPQGQLQFLSIVNYQLLMLNYSGQICLLNLKIFPYIQFCIEVVLGNIERLQAIYKNCNCNLQKSMKEVLQIYGVILPQYN